jgi:hypothetical protein
MSTSKRPTPREELERIEDALVDSILNASGDELREELAVVGLDPECCIAEVEATIAAAKIEHARERLKGARTELAAWRRRGAQVDVTELDAARAKFDRLRTGDQDLNQRMMLAARNLAALEKLEGR